MYVTTKLHHSDLELERKRHGKRNRTKSDNGELARRRHFKDTTVKTTTITQTKLDNFNVTATEQVKTTSFIPQYLETVETNTNFSTADITSTTDKLFSAAIESVSSSKLIINSSPESSTLTVSSFPSTEKISLTADMSTTEKPFFLPSAGNKGSKTGLGPARLDFATFKESQRKMHTGSSMAIDTKSVHDRLPPYHIENEEQHMCYCEQDRRRNGISTSYSELAQKEREQRRKLRDQRIKKKRRKLRKKLKMDKECLSERMNCFRHDNDHWRTAPFWREGDFCFCMNANNNTYSCVRTINSTHNFLYCEFVTGFVTFYNLRIDPFETQNRAKYLTSEEKSFLHDQLEELKRCKGKSCTVNNNRSHQPEMAVIQPSKVNPRRQGGLHSNSRTAGSGSNRNVNNHTFHPYNTAVNGVPSALRLVDGSSDKQSQTEDRTSLRGHVVKPWRKRKSTWQQQYSRTADRQKRHQRRHSRARHRDNTTTW